MFRGRVKNNPKMSVIFVKGLNGCAEVNRDRRGLYENYTDPEVDPVVELTSINCKSAHDRIKSTCVVVTTLVIYHY